ARSSSASCDSVSHVRSVAPVFGASYPVASGDLFSCFGASFFSASATTELYPRSLHDALPIWPGPPPGLRAGRARGPAVRGRADRSEEHTSELQSRFDLVCRLLLEKKKSGTPASERLRRVPHGSAPPRRRALDVGRRARPRLVS